MSTSKDPQVRRPALTSHQSSDRELSEVAENPLVVALISNANPDGGPVPKAPFLLLLFSSSALAAPEAYTITASSLYHPGDHAGGEVTVISEEDMERNQDLFVRDVLREAPSVPMSGRGDNGRMTRFSMRGAIGGENLVLVDGVRVNDPAASGGIFDFADVMVDDLAQVEILPGANSVIYGSDAMGGVINLVTKTGRGEPTLKLKAEGGSFYTGQGAATVQGEEGPLCFSFTGSGFRSGSGSFKNKVHGNRQSDKYRNGLGSGRIRYAVAPNVDAEGVLRWSEAKLRFDQFVAGLPRKANNHTHSRQVVGQGKLHGSFFGDFWEQILRVTRSETRRKHHVPMLDFKTRGYLYGLHSRSDLNWSEQQITTVGGEYGWEHAKETFAGKHQRDHQGLYAQHLSRLWEGSELVGGLRFDHYENVGERVTYRIAASQTCDQTRLRTSYGTGFKAPLLSDQFNISPFVVPNRSLRPEKNHSVDVGVDQKFWGDQVEANLTTFLNIIDNVFVTQFKGSKLQRINGGRRRARGVEGKLRIEPCSVLTLTTNATFTHARDHVDGRSRRSPHIPQWVLNGRVILRPCEDFKLFFSTHTVSSQKDAVTRNKLKPFTTLALGGDVAVTKGVELYGRVENLTDKRYEETFGYGVRGRTFYVGLRAKI